MQQTHFSFLVQCLIFNTWRWCQVTTPEVICTLVGTHFIADMKWNWVFVEWWHCLLSQFSYDLFFCHLLFYIQVYTAFFFVVVVVLFCLHLFVCFGIICDSLLTLNIYVFLKQVRIGHQHERQTKYPVLRKVVFKKLSLGSQTSKRNPVGPQGLGITECCFVKFLINILDPRNKSDDK